jgi:hypothetical protein
MKFEVDKIKITGPKVDGGFTVSLDVGEYEQHKIAQLLTIPQDVIKTVEVTHG